MTTHRRQDRRRYLALLCILAAFAPALLAQQGFYLKSGDVVVFYGDSITDQRLYTTFVETFTVTRFPRLAVRFIHSGWGGDRVSGGGGGPIDVRLRRDAIAYQPTVMTVMLGMNDGSYQTFDPAIFNEFKTGYEHIVQTMKDAIPGLRMTLIQPSPYDDVTRPPMFEGGYNAVLVRYCQFVRELAAKNGLATADLNTPVVEMLRTAYAADPVLARKIIEDRIHPGNAGHLIMAGALLKAWGATPLVTTVEIDAAAKQVKQAVNTDVTGLDTAPAISWTQKDKALPMPVDLKNPVMALAVHSSDFMQSLNRETLKVTGLREGSYALHINGSAVATFSAGQLANGVNLAEFSTPMEKQSEAVHALTQKRAGVHNMRWRQLQTVFESDGLARVQTIMENLDALDNDLLVRQRAAAQPAASFYELTPETAGRVGPP